MFNFKINRDTLKGFISLKIIIFTPKHLVQLRVQVNFKIMLSSNRIQYRNNDSMLHLYRMNEGHPAGPLRPLLMNHSLTHALTVIARLKSTQFVHKIPFHHQTCPRNNSQCSFVVRNDILLLYFLRYDKNYVNRPLLHRS